MKQRTVRHALRAGVSAMDITPPVGFRLVGHTRRDQRSTGVNDPLRCKVLTVFDGVRRVAIVSADLLGFDERFLAGLRLLLKKRRGMGQHAVILAASHTHTGPCVDPACGFVPKDHVLPAYVNHLQEKIVGGIYEAIHREEPVAVGYAADHVNVGAINRRKPTPKGIAFAPHPDGLIDDRLDVLRFDRRDGSALAVLFRYSCHPTTLSSDLFEISADYPGSAQSHVEKAVPGATAFFLQGCCGDVRPAIVDGDAFIGGTFADVERIGTALAKRVVAAIDNTKPVRGRTVASRQQILRMPFDRKLMPTKASDLRLLSDRYLQQTEQPSVVAAWASHWRSAYRHERRIPASAPMRLHALRIGDVVLLGLGGEVMAAYGPRIRERVGGKVLVLGHVDSDSGYLPTREALSQGGYEAEYHLFVPYPAPFAPTVEERVLRACDRLVAQVTDNNA